MAIIHAFPQKITPSPASLPGLHTYTMKLRDSHLPIERTLLLDGGMPLRHAVAHFIHAFDPFMEAAWLITTRDFTWEDGDGLSTLDPSRRDIPIREVFSLSDEFTLTLDDTWVIDITLANISEKAGRFKSPACMDGVAMSPVGIFLTPEEFHAYVAALQEPHARKSKKLLSTYPEYAYEDFDRRKLTKLLRNQDALEFFEYITGYDVSGMPFDELSDDEMEAIPQDLESSAADAELRAEIDGEISIRLYGGFVDGTLYPPDSRLAPIYERLMKKHGEEKTMAMLRDAFMLAAICTYLDSKKDYETELAKTLAHLH